MAPVRVKRQLVEKSGSAKQPSTGAASPSKVRVRPKPVTLPERFQPEPGTTVLAKRGGPDGEFVPAKLLKRKAYKAPGGTRFSYYVQYLDTDEKNWVPNEDYVRPRSENRALTRKLSEKARTREAYREKHNVTMTTCRDNLAQLSDFAKMHTVTFPDGSVREIEAFTQTALGEPLGTTGVTVTRWVGSGMLPRPILETSRGAVYHIEEVRSFVDLVSKHQETHKQYRSDHSDTKDKIFAENARVRKALLSPPADQVRKKLKVRRK